MRKIESIEEFKHLQLGVLLAIHEFCMKQDIQYSIAAGTLIGAIRHKGYIPWDDDIDIYLLRPQYNRLINEFPQIYNNRYRLNSLERNDKWNRNYAKAYDSLTIEKEGLKNDLDDMGVSIDIFPIDDVPDNKGKWKIYNQFRWFVNNLYMWKAGNPKDKPFLKKIGIKLIHILLSPISFRVFAKWLNRFHQRFNGQGYQHVFENCWALKHKNDCFSKKDFEETIDVDFEGYKFKAIKGYHNYLTLHYGDYMKLPPKEKQVAHHTFQAWWKE